MLDSDWEYIIESVVSKNPAKRSRYHDLIIGKRCIIPDNQELPYCIGSMIIEAFGDYHSSSHWSIDDKYLHIRRQSISI